VLSRPIASPNVTFFVTMRANYRAPRRQTGTDGNTHNRLETRALLRGEGNVYMPASVGFVPLPRLIANLPAVATSCADLERRPLPAAGITRLRR
jgi:hypothetical protein